MNPICRISPISRTTNTIFVSNLFRHSPIPLPFQKGYYSHEAYGSDDEPRGPTQTTQDPSASRRLEHPGPPPPNVSKRPSTPPTHSPSATSTTSPPRTASDSESASSEPPARKPVSLSPKTPPIPSNKAHPTLNDGKQSPNVDERGELKSDVPEDVKRHNVEVDRRYDKSYNRIGDGGKVEKGFWTADRH